MSFSSKKKKIIFGCETVSSARSRATAQIRHSVVCCERRKASQGERCFCTDTVPSITTFFYSKIGRKSNGKCPSMKFKSSQFSLRGQKTECIKLLTTSSLCCSRKKKKQIGKLGLNAANAKLLTPKCGFVCATP